MLRAGLLARCVEAFVLLLRAGVARCVCVDARLLWLTVGLVARCALDVERLSRAGVAARLVPLRVVLLVLRTEFVLGAVARVRVAGVAVSRVGFVLLLERTASRVRFVVFERAASVLRLVAERTLRLSVVCVAFPRVAVVLRLLAACVAAVRPLVVRLAVRTVAASATRAGRADVRLLRSTSGR